MPLLPVSPHPVQLALWGPDRQLASPGSQQRGIHFDKASISISESTDDLRPRIAQRLTINGEVRPMVRYPAFQAYKKRSVVRDLPSFDALPSRTRECPYCQIPMNVFETYERGPEDADRAAGELLE
jgi:hypothetical protein